MNKLVNMDKPIFSLTISPHRSLSPTGFAVFLGIVAFLNLTAGVVFWYLGAWPVVGFMGLDVVLIWIAFRWSYRQALRHENLTITGLELHLSRYADNRLLERRAFPRGFVHVHLEHDGDRGLTGRLFLRSKGQTYEVGSFLGAQERSALAEALTKALAKPRI
jgi:uncharacterized membrane protein